ncbi:MAG: MATE family efflux transporter [Roseburia inulinivorans]
METNEKSRVLDMTRGNPFRLVLKFALPLFFGNLLQQFYNLADTAIAGHVLGDHALAQIGAVSALYGLITNFAFGMNNGLALSLSRSFGAGDEQKMKHASCWMVTISMSVSIVLMSIFLLCKEPLLILLQVPEETMAGAMEYLTIILIGIPFTMAYNMEAAMLQAVGNSMTPLLFLLFSSVLNISLDYVFMALLAMGIGGAAFATVLSQGVSAFLAFILIWRNYPLLHFKRNDYQVEKKFVLEMVVAGFSMALMSAIYNIGSVILQGSINALGNLYITAQVGARRLAELFHTPGLALGTSVATYTSQNMGGGNRNRIKKRSMVSILSFCNLVDFFHDFCHFLRGRCCHTGNRKQ